MTRSRLRSWNAVGTRGSRSSTRDTGYQWSRHTNLSAESGADVLGSASPGTDVGAATRRRGPVVLRREAARGGSDGSSGRAE